MKWITEHFQILFVIAGVVAFWIQKRREAAEARREAEAAMEARRQRQAQQQRGAPLQRHASDSADAERTRRIQEEIRRKIAERRGEVPGMPPPAPVAPPPLPRAESAARTREPRSNAYDTAEERAVRERQRQMAEQLAALEAQRAAVRNEAVEIRARGARPPRPETAPAPAFRSGLPVSLAADLHDRSSLRRAIVLKEILDTPKALRA